MPAIDYALIRSARTRQPMLHRVIVAGDNLPAQPLRHMNHERRLEIQRQAIRRHGSRSTSTCASCGFARPSG